MLVAAGIVILTGWKLADPLVGAGIGLLIVPRTCSLKTMLPVGGVILAAAGAAFFAFEEARTAILASLPFLLFLLCPLSMLFMMKAMHSGSQELVKAPAGVDGPMREAPAAASDPVRVS